MGLVDITPDLATVGLLPLIGVQGMGKKWFLESGDRAPGRRGDLQQTCRGRGRQMPSLPLVCLLSYWCRSPLAKPYGSHWAGPSAFRPLSRVEKDRERLWSGDTRCPAHPVSLSSLICETGHYQSYPPTRLSVITGRMLRPQ